MPDGVVQWFDPSRGEGVIRRGGRRYPVREAAMEPVARVGGARVHFDVTRTSDGDIAENVTLREGTRVSKTQRRFGDVRGGKVPEEATAAEAEEPVEEAAAGIVELSSAGSVRSSELAYARDKIDKVVADVGRPVLHCSIRLEMAADPALDKPAAARATVDVDGEPVRTSVRAREMTEAVDLLEARMRRRLVQLAEHRQTLRRRGPSSPTGEWRHGDAPTERPPFFPRPAEERELVRRKTFTTPEATVDEAIFDMESLDHDFFLFRDLGTGQDAVVHRLEGGAYGLRYQDGPDPDNGLETTAAAVEVDEAPAPRLDVGDARAQLADSGAPWLFFVDAASGRGRILYRRADGHDGLITPA